MNKSVRLFLTGVWVLIVQQLLHKRSRMIGILMALIHVSLASGVYDISKINSSSGLPSDNVKDIYQDSEGFIWFCTTEGLIRYDGYELKEYSIAGYHDKGLITNLFNAIDEDSDGNLWCATDRGVTRLNAVTEEFTFYNIQSQEPYQLQIDVINTLKVDKHDQVWIGTAGSGVEVLSPKQGITAWYHSLDGISGMNSDWVTHLYVDSSDRIWAG
jgi:ligand-binding sensor domain-containing protein